MEPNLNTPVAQRLLKSNIPARLAFVGPNRDPHVLPIWFLWKHKKIVLCSGHDSFKVKAIREHPQVALSIDSETTPYESLRIRGLAEIEVIKGIPTEYVECAHRFYGRELGQRWINWVSNHRNQMARISVTPDWAESLDFRLRFSEIFD